MNAPAYKSMRTDIESIKVPETRMRELKPAGVERLIESMTQLGQINPITILPDGTLISGLHRYEAAKRLGWKLIAVNVLELDDAHAQLAEIDENIIREELNVLERAEHLARRKEIYEALFPETKRGAHGGRGGKKLDPDSGSNSAFVDDTAKKTGRARSKISEEVKLVKDLPEEVRDAVRDTPIAENKEDLKRLANEKDEKKRDELIRRVADGEAKNVKEAARQLTYEQKQETSLDRVNGPFDIIYADPPWQYSNDGMSGAAANHYPTMPTDEICDLDVEGIASDDAVLFLWTTNPHLPDAMRVMEAWGFEYKTNLVWVKDKGTGIAFYLNGYHELLLIGTKGSMLPQKKPKSVLDTKRGEHSRKPDEIYDLIDEMYPGLSRVELFCRRPRGGWAVWGNEV